MKERLDAVEKNSLLDEASLAPTDSYETSRKAIAKALGWRASTLDEDREQAAAGARQRRRRSGDRAALTIEPWPHEVTDIGAVLDAAVTELKPLPGRPRSDLPRHDRAVERFTVICSTATSLASASRRSSPCSRRSSAAANRLRSSAHT